MAYSTEAQCRANLDKAQKTADAPQAMILDRIANADKQIQVDLARYIDFDLVPDDAVSCNFINMLSQFKTCELVLVRMFGAQRNIEEVDDITYWQKEYDALLQQVIDGIIPAELNDGTAIGTGGQTFVNRAKTGIAPALGVGKYGGNVSDETLADARPEGSDYDDVYDINDSE